MTRPGSSAVLFVRVSTGGMSEYTPVDDAMRHTDRRVNPDSVRSDLWEAEAISASCPLKDA